MKVWMRGNLFWKLMTVLLILPGPGWVHAQDIRINTRPLTPQEITDYGLPSDTQIANGTAVVGLGQPVYLELLVEQAAGVTQVVWNLDGVFDERGRPITSSAVITSSPLGMEIPTYDVGDRLDFDVVDRAVIVPDVKGLYAISVQAETADDTLQSSIDVVGSVFIGKDYYLCVLCHATKQAPFNATAHAEAFKTQITGEDSNHFQEFCIKCHVVGYDSAPAAVNAGFDDVANDVGWMFPEELSPDNWDNMPEVLKNKANVQCESCHGPADEHVQSLGDTGRIAISISAGSCSQCHDSLPYHVKAFEWGQTPHAQGNVFRASGSCAPCHSTRGYIDANDPGISELGDIVPTAGTGNEGITCAACHDPHSPGAGAHQVRAIESVELPNGDLITEGGDGLICMACHKSRQDAENYVLGAAGGNFGPHYGPQADMLSGHNAIEYGQNMPNSTHLTAVENSCAQCHMQDPGTSVPPYAENKVGGHTYTLVYDDGTNDVVYLTDACSTCHGEIESFDFGGEDLNRDGFIDGVQTEISLLLDDLGILLPPFGSTSVSGRDLETLELRRGAYNYLFVDSDGSLGVHNPKYAAALLRASIDDLKGGIDVDRDGLVDSWEIENFNDLTSQSGADDYDGDGLNNIEEFNFGTDPVLRDTDGDGFSDLIEVEGNSDPLDIDSVPLSDMLILSAVEVGYLPQTNGTSVRFQSIGSLTGGSWTNMGSAQPSTGDWLYQLDSVRGKTNQFYRAIEE
jgi:hypothetical protein